MRKLFCNALLYKIHLCRVTRIAKRDNLCRVVSLRNDVFSNQIYRNNKVFACAVPMFFYTITEKRQAEMVAEIEARKATK